jgi:hypothetical protein
MWPDVRESAMLLLGTMLGDLYAVFVFGVLCSCGPQSASSGDPLSRLATLSFGDPMTSVQGCSFGQDVGVAQ